jgi:hypothetical protein
MSGKDSKSNSITKLTSSNYPTWKGEMKAYLHVKDLWLLVNGSETRPASDTDLQAKWDIKADKAAWELYLACSVEQRMHLDTVQDDLVKIWTTRELQAAFLAEESQCRRHPEGPGGDAALFTASATCH